MHVRYRFSLRDSLLLTTIVALALGWLFDHLRSSAKIEAMTPLLQRASPIEGRVVYEDSGKPAVGVRISAQAHSGHVIGNRATYGTAMTDGEGRYRLVNLSPANWNVWAETGGWTVIAIDSLPVVAGQEVKDADLKLIKGGVIKGRVIDGVTGKPTSMAGGQQIMIGVYGPARPRTSAAVTGGPVDRNGEFQLQVPPGKNYPYVMSINPRRIGGGMKYLEEGVDVANGKETEIEFRLGSPP
jgi:hypothetical protein